MTDDKPTVDDLVYRPNKYLLGEYGDFGAEIIPQVRTHDAIMALIATLDQEETKDIYDPEGQLWRRLCRTRDLVRDDIKAAIIQEYNNE